ncbi:MAG: phage holin family protein [Bacteroidia bacterium]|nr:phage holin family protein [Bacteroidia bacterium]
METHNKELDDLISEGKEYLETRSKLGKLKAIDKGSQIGASAISALCLVFFSFLFILFLSMAAAIFISERLNSNYAGFLFISIFYLLIGILVYAKGDTWIKKPMVNVMIKNFLKDSDNEN